MKTKKIDFKLITELQKDGGIRYLDLSAKLNITPKTVAKRIEGLINSRVIAIRAQPNPYKLGLSASALIAIKVKPSKIKYVCERLCEYFNVNLVYTVFGRFDIITIIYFPNWELLHQFINNELNAIEGVLQFEFYFIKEIFKRYERFFEKEPFEKYQLKLQEPDWILIKELVKDGRSNCAELAEKLETHITTVYRRISALIKGNLIKISAVPTSPRLASHTNAYVILSVNPKEVENICNSLYNFPEVHFFVILNKQTEIIVLIYAINNEKLYEILMQKIFPLKGLINMETFIRATVEKAYYGWFIETDQEQDIED